MTLKNEVVEVKRKLKGSSEEDRWPFLLSLEFRVYCHRIKCFIWIFKDGLQAELISSQITITHKQFMPYLFIKTSLSLSSSPPGQPARSLQSVRGQLWTGCGDGGEVLPGQHAVCWNLWGKKEEKKEWITTPSRGRYMFFIGGYTVNVGKRILKAQSCDLPVMGSFYQRVKSVNQTLNPLHTSRSSNWVSQVGVYFFFWCAKQCFF